MSTTTRRSSRRIRKEEPLETNSSKKADEVPPVPLEEKTQTKSDSVSKKPEMKENNEENKEEEKQCGICLEPPKIRGQLDSCAHHFCFECIHQWSKTTNTCPFCKARFKQITKLDPSARRPSKIKVKHKDQRPPTIEPNWTEANWIEFDSEDDEEYDERFYLESMMPFIIDDSDEDQELIVLDPFQSHFGGFPMHLYQDVIDLTMDSSFLEPVVIPDSPQPTRQRTTTRRSTRTRTTRNSTTTSRRTSVRTVNRTPPVETQRNRTNSRSNNARRFTTNQHRQQPRTVVNDLGRRYRISS